MTVLILPGINNSGAEHWQTKWQQLHPEYCRVQQDNWDEPMCADWVGALEQAVKTVGEQAVLVAHSLACLMVVHWAAQTQQRIKAAFLVAMPDPTGPNFPLEAKGFVPLPQQRLPFRSMIVASTNDPYSSTEFTQGCALHWGSEWVAVGALGHINAASGLGDWPQGQALFAELVAKA